MPRYKLTIEYEGTRYSGWQRQKNARTIQGELIKAAQTVFDSDNFELYGSGRTDSGVHALGQTAHIDVRTMLAPDIIRMKLNDELPADIAVRFAEKVSPRFHARHDAEARSYLYQISRRRTALGKRYVWWIKDRLNIVAMQQAAEEFIGMHDFRSFSADDPDEKSTKVAVETCRIESSGDLILIRIVGSHFLWNMVRRITGSLAEVGRGNLGAKDIQTFLMQKSDIPARLTAPPSGLFLEKVYYAGDIRLDTIRPVMSI